jgi:fermentation-respiration switch protein FrsA (DUF1100 family)
MSGRRGPAAIAALAAGVLVAGVLLAGSCAPEAERTTPAIRVVAPRTGVTTMSLAPAEADGLTRFDSWPKACELLTPADLRAILPQVTKVVQTPREQEIRVTNLGDGDGDDRDAPGSSCETRFWVAGTEKNRHAQPDLLRVEDIAVGDTDTVKDNYDSLAGSRPRVPGGLGALECVRAAPDYYCRLPHIAFSVGAGPSLYIDSFVGQPKKVEAHTYWVDNVLPELVRAVAAKLPHR